MALGKGIPNVITSKWSVRAHACAGGKEGEIHIFPCDAITNYIARRWIRKPR